MMRAGIRAVAIACVSFACTVHAGDVFNACKSNKNSKVRAASIIADGPSLCRSTETAVTWSETGPVGPQGPAGPSGAFATSKVIGSDGLPISIPTSFVTLGTLNLPAGSYVATASLYLTNRSGSPGIALCGLFVQEGATAVANAQVADAIADQGAVSQAPTVAATLTAAGTVELGCTNNAASGTLEVQTFNLNAIKVGSLTAQ